ncbi:hypothetical protein, conserved [Babesia ovata]|uniref:Uncharacterized protein n=1 Tax=Babesia ovata TaxID=189622 RepID=A0A2H6K9V6_9APIC|nr:uncharacterized protein BOVATA_012660 [Babesia ovata]GBE59773.1 hypothetical protein, conserved [Babesia ovata]
MVYTSLTEAPRNLKEGIDWLMAVKGTDGENNLKAMGAAVYNFLADKPVGKMEVPALEEVKVITKEFLEQKEFEDGYFLNKLLDRFKKRMKKQKPGFFAKHFDYVYKSDYENIIQTGGVTADAMVKNVAKVVRVTERFLKSIQVADKYESAYSSEATWDASCAKDPEACAIVLVGIAPMLHTGILYLQYRCFRATESGGPGSVEEKRLANALEALGYKKSEQNVKMGVSDILRAFSCVGVELFVILHDLAGFWAFY